MNKLEKILITIGAMAISADALTLLVKQRYDMCTYNPFKVIAKE